LLVFPLGMGADAVYLVDLVYLVGRT